MFTPQNHESMHGDGRCSQQPVDYLELPGYDFWKETSQLSITSAMIGWTVPLKVVFFVSLFVSRKWSDDRRRRRRDARKKRLFKTTNEEKMMVMLPAQFCQQWTQTCWLWNVELWHHTPSASVINSLYSCVSGEIAPLPAGWICLWTAGSDTGRPAESWTRHPGKTFK